MHHIYVRTQITMKNVGRITRFQLEQNQYPYQQIPVSLHRSQTLVIPILPKWSKHIFINNQYPTCTLLEVCTCQQNMLGAWELPVTSAKHNHKGARCDVSQVNQDSHCYLLLPLNPQPWEPGAIHLQTGCSSSVWLFFFLILSP